MIALIGVLGIIALLIGLVLYSTFSWGFVLYKFWAWFLIPIFPNLPQLTIMEAIGLMFMIGLFHARNYTSIKKEFKEKTTEYASMVLSPWIALIIASFFN